VAPAAVAHYFYSPHPVADIDFRLRKKSPHCQLSFSCVDYVK
jgi:hypothetical protein